MMISASLIQFDVVPLAAERNIERMCTFIETEAAQGAKLVVFPELSNTGYVEPLIPGGPMVSAVPHYGKALYDACADLDGPQVQKLKDMAATYDVVLVAGLGIRDRRLAGVMHNASLLITPAGVEGVYVKIHQWHNEKLYFTRGDSIATYPVFGTRLGMQICYDIRFPEITRIMACEGAGIITSIWASFGAASKPVADEGLYIHRAYTRAVENGVYFLSCNRAGLHGDQRFMGRSCVIAPDGRVVGNLAHDREDVLRVELDLDDIARYRAATGIWTDRTPELYARYASLFGKIR
mgnify:CR=1 FL=1